MRLFIPKSLVHWSPFLAVSRNRNLDVSNNQLTGGIPDAYTTLTALQALDIAGNFINGSLPAGLSALLALTTLHTCGNLLSGDAPQYLVALAGTR